MNLMVMEFYVTITVIYTKASSHSDLNKARVRNSLSTAQSILVTLEEASTTVMDS